MPSHDCINTFKLIGEIEGDLTPFCVNGNDDQLLDTGGDRLFDGRDGVREGLAVVEVTVGVDQSHLRIVALIFWPDAAKAQPKSS